MSNSIVVLIFSAVLAAVVISVFVIYIKSEKKKKKTISKEFRTFAENYQMSQNNMRAVPRITIPDSLDVVLTLTDNDYFGLRAYALDMSLSGFSVKPDFPLKKLPMNILVKNVLVVSTINTFAVKEMKTVRIDHHIEKRVMAFHITQIDEDQFENLKTFMTYLDEFLKKGNSEEL
jgi:Tfp pilus assembly protein PilE